MTEGEITAFLQNGHTGILGTVRADGSPAANPLWYVTIDGSVFVRTLANSAKAKHLRRNPCVSFVVETGRAWAELRAVVIYGEAKIEATAEAIVRIDEAFGSKYAGFLMPAAVSQRTRGHYAQDRIHVRIAPTRRVLSWENAKLLSSSSA